MKNIYLSYPLSINTPAYAGGESIEIKKIKSLCAGDSCNQFSITMTNHIGTHVDVPAHFIKNGKTITDYEPDEWVFNRCCMIDIPCIASQIINDTSISAMDPDYNCDLLIIRTGFEQFRDDELYWRKSPVFHKSLGNFFATEFHQLRAIAFDCISLSSLTDRVMGRESHREVLGRNFLIFEDVRLSVLKSTPLTVSAYPLLIDNADGAQVTMVAETR